MFHFHFTNYFFSLPSGLRVIRRVTTPSRSQVQGGLFWNHLVLKRPEIKKHATETWNNKVVDKPPNNIEKEYDALQIQRIQKFAWSITDLLLKYEWTSTFAAGHLLSEQPMSWDERELLNGWKQKVIDTHPVIPISRSGWCPHRHRHKWFLRDTIYVRSQTEKIGRQMTLHLLACKCVGIILTSKSCDPLVSIAREQAQ